MWRNEKTQTNWEPSYFWSRLINIIILTFVRIVVYEINSRDFLPVFHHTHIPQCQADAWYRAPPCMVALAGPTDALCINRKITRPCCWRFTNISNGIHSLRIFITYVVLFLFNIWSNHVDIHKYCKISTISSYSNYTEPPLASSIQCF